MTLGGFAMVDLSGKDKFGAARTGFFGVEAAGAGLEICGLAIGTGFLTTGAGAGAGLRTGTTGTITVSGAAGFGLKAGTGACTGAAISLGRDRTGGAASLR
jgi:hypothetical protein